MKLFIILLVMGFITVQTAFAHKEWVHQYILFQAYRYLTQQLGKPVPVFYRQIMQGNNGTLNAKDKGQFGNVPIEHSPAATIGIYREDVFDLEQSLC